MQEGGKGEPLPQGGRWEVYWGFLLEPRWLGLVWRGLGEGGEGWEVEGKVRD